MNRRNFIQASIALLSSISSKTLLASGSDTELLLMLSKHVNRGSLDSRVALLALEDNCVYQWRSCCKKLLSYPKIIGLGEYHQAFLLSSLAREVGYETTYTSLKDIDNFYAIDDMSVIRSLIPPEAYSNHLMYWQFIKTTKVST